VAEFGVQKKNVRLEWSDPYSIKDTEAFSSELASLLWRPWALV